MIKWLRELVSPTKSNDVDTLTLQSEVQSLRLSVSEMEQRYQSLTQIIQQERTLASALQQQMIVREMETLFTEIAAPATQLLTQQYLIEVCQQSIQAKDIMAVFKRLLQSLQNRGVEWIGNPGDQTTYNSEFHSPLASQSTISMGEMVIIRFVGVKYAGKILRKAGVEKVEETNKG